MPRSQLEAEVAPYLWRHLLQPHAHRRGSPGRARAIGFCATPTLEVRPRPAFRCRCTVPTASCSSRRPTCSRGRFASSSCGRRRSTPSPSSSSGWRGAPAGGKGRLCAADHSPATAVGKGSGAGLGTSGEPQRPLAWRERRQSGRTPPAKRRHGCELTRRHAKCHSHGVNTLCGRRLPRSERLASLRRALTRDAAHRFISNLESELHATNPHALHEVLSGLPARTSLAAC